MKICPACGKELEDNAVTCPYCGYAENKNSTNENANTADSNNTSVGNAPAAPAASQVPDKANVWLCILSVLIPLVGLILWIVKRNETPKAARTYGICALVAWIASILLSVCSGVVLGILEGLAASL